LNTVGFWIVIIWSIAISAAVIFLGYAAIFDTRKFAAYYLKYGKRKYWESLPWIPDENEIKRKRFFANLRMLAIFLIAVGILGMYTAVSAVLK
jgi:hypothetical protein